MNVFIAIVLAVSICKLIVWWILDLKTMKNIYFKIAKDPEDAMRILAFILFIDGFIGILCFKTMLYGY